MKLEKFLKKLLGKDFDTSVEFDNTIFYIDTGWLDKKDCQKRLDKFIKDIENKSKEGEQ